jgi:hypothetical protein
MDNRTDLEISEENTAFSKMNDFIKECDTRTEGGWSECVYDSFHSFAEMYPKPASIVPKYYSRISELFGHKLTPGISVGILKGLYRVYSV